MESPHLSEYMESPIGIHGAPAEVLCVIFLLVDDEQGLRNYRLSLVCKAWRTLIDGTPAMWTQVRVEWTPRSGSWHTMLNSWEYIDICLEKSGDCPLDITVELSSQPPYKYYYEKVMQSRLLPVGVDLKERIKQLDGEEWSPTSLVNLLPSENSDEAERLYYSASRITLCKLARKSAGPNAPWRSLQLDLSNPTEENLYTLQELTIPFSQLTELEWQGDHTRFLDFTVFRALMKLKTNQRPSFPDDWHSILPLKQLELEDDDVIADFLCTSNPSFHLLESLKLNLSPEHWMRLNTNRERILESGHILHLPLLKTLEIDVDPARVLKTIEATHLKTLRLYGGWFRPFRDIALFRSVEKVCLWFSRFDTVPASVSEGLEPLLQQCKNLVQMTILCWDAQYDVLLELFTAFVDKSKDKGALLSPLKTIHIKRAFHFGITAPEKITTLTTDT